MVKLRYFWLYRVHILTWGICKKIGSCVFTSLLSSTIYNRFVFDNSYGHWIFPSFENFFKAIQIPSLNRLGWDNFLHYKIKNDWVSTCCDGEKQWKRLPLNSTKANLIEFVTWFFFSLSTLVWKAARNLHMYYTLRPL